MALFMFVPLATMGVLFFGHTPRAFAQDADVDPFEPLRDEGDPDLDAQDEQERSPLFLHYGFALGIGTGSSFLEPPRRSAIEESVWALRFSLGVPFAPLEEGTFSAAFDFALEYPTDIRTSSGQNRHRFRIDPRIAYAWEVLFLDDVALVLEGGLGFGVERVHFARSDLLAYGPTTSVGATAYIDRVALLTGHTPFARMNFRYKPALSKYRSTGGPSDEELVSNPPEARTGFAARGSFSSLGTGADLGVSGERRADGSRDLAFVGFGYDWQRYLDVRREAGVGPGVRANSSASIGFTTFHVGFERSF
jgi:hypothetical protein